MKQGEKDGNFNPVTEDTQFESGETIILGNGEGVWANVGVRFFVNKKKNIYILMKKSNLILHLLFLLIMGYPIYRY